MDGWLERISSVSSNWFIVSVRTFHDCVSILDHITLWPYLSNFLPGVPSGIRVNVQPYSTVCCLIFNQCFESSDKLWANQTLRLAHISHIEKEWREQREKVIWSGSEYLVERLRVLLGWEASSPKILTEQKTLIIVDRRFENESWKSTHFQIRAVCCQTKLLITASIASFHI